MMKYLIIAGVVAALAAGLVIQKGVIEARTLERDKYKANALAYKDTLEAYRSSFADVVDTLNTENRAAIKAQENLLRTLNLIGDINESENGIVSDSSLAIIDSLYP